MKKIWSVIDSTVRENKTAVLCTVVSGNSETCPVGTKFLINETGSDFYRNLDDGQVLLLRENYAEVMRTKSPKIASSHWKDDVVRIFFDPIYPRAHLVIFGGGHLSVPLVSIGKLLDYQVTVIDDRLAFANEVRFPDADTVICQDFKTAIQEMSFNANTYAVIVTRGHSHDKTCLAEMLKKEETVYLGMIGSKRKIAALFSDLLDEGFEQAQLNKVYTPIGLEIGAQTPEEIAVSIMAEIIMVNHYGCSSRQVK